MITDSTHCSCLFCSRQKKIWVSLLVLLINVFFLVGCTNDPTSEMEVVAGESPTSSKDYFEYKVNPQMAKHFTVSYHGNYKVVRTNATFYQDRDAQEGESREDLLVLVQKGTDPPPLTGQLQGAEIISIPVASVAVNVQHSESFLRELGLEHLITAIGGLFSYNKTMRSRAMSGEIGQVGYSWHSPPNIEVLLDRKPELFLMTMASLDHTSSLEKCRRLGVKTATVFDWAEQDYLARAEWVKFYSLFFNAEEKANEVFQKISTRVQELKSIADKTEPETALWGYHTSKGKWLVQINSFPGQYLRDANLDNVLIEHTQPNADGLQTLTTEQLLTHGKRARHWVIGDIHASPLPGEEIMTTFQAWNAGTLLHNMERVDPTSNTSDWYATAIVRPDSVLADVIKLTRPELLPGYQPAFMGYYEKSNN